ncbi:Gfo/Idh/MocA family oxidoreductase [Marispirochaeta aestuarii]|uniref:Gfo/Idh/MocA family protein n=1 Tax=Marispirochaeta aestuarii TaxID=1963862 RepID=UPI0029C676BE|nr:Gfo/Idh/MocA family oxidoreductase [Marispirochaeta aestuarii]
MRKLRIGVVGIGKISGVYLENLTGRFSDFVTVVALADHSSARAGQAAERYGIPRVLTVSELMKCPDLDMVLILTRPDSHYELCRDALEEGKHVYLEKPLSMHCREAEELLKIAADRGLRIGSAPDTFLGAGLQTCIKLIDDGWIGAPIGCTAFMMNHGPEHWHPGPEFLYKAGAGPMFDVGPYYLTALVALIGPVIRVQGMAKRGFDTRIIGSGPRKGKIFNVEVPTYVAGTMEFENGAIGTIVTSFDVWQHSLPFIEIYGTEGSLRVPNPNTFGGPVSVSRGANGKGEKWTEIPLAFPYRENCRGLGVAELADSILAGRAHRASGELALHVLELMHGFHIAAEAAEAYRVENHCIRPQKMNPGGLKIEI